MNKANSDKPAGYKGFDELTKKLMNVPKEELDKKVKRYEDQKKSKKES